MNHDIVGSYLLLSTQDVRLCIFAIVVSKFLKCRRCRPKLPNGPSRHDGDDTAADGRVVVVPLPPLHPPELPIGKDTCQLYFCSRQCTDSVPKATETMTVPNLVSQMSSLVSFFFSFPACVGFAKQNNEKISSKFQISKNPQTWVTGQH